MRTKTRREAILLTSGMVALGGCSALGGSETLNQVELNSDSDENHTVSVEVLGGDGEMLFSQSFELPAQMAKEDIEPFSGEPAEVVVRIDEAEPLQSEWPQFLTELRPNETPETLGEGCGQTPGESVTGVSIIVIDPARVRLDPTCSAPR